MGAIVDLRRSKEELIAEKVFLRQHGDVLFWPPHRVFSIIPHLQAIVLGQLCVSAPRHNPSFVQQQDRVEGIHHG
jgi:hypothetical protein